MHTTGLHDDGLWLAEAPDGPYDMLIDGQRVWSFNPHRDARRQGAGWRIPWPRPLAKYLSGVGHVWVGEHNTGEVLFDGDVRLGNSDAPIRVTDAAGHPLALNKTGHVGRSFDERDEASIDRLVRHAGRALDLLNGDGGVTAFLAFGGLLGAVRDGHLIGHDVDLDLGYLSEHRYPVDAARESFRLERLFRRAGWQTWRWSADDFKVLVPGISTTARWIDVFGGFVADGTFYLMPTVAVPESRVRIHPLGEVVLEGHRLAAPADPSALLEATYGPGWRIPDPSFEYQTPAPVRQRMDGWMRNTVGNRGHWQPFYEFGTARSVPEQPSDFARWCLTRFEPGTAVVDVGCGTGRDTLWFAAQGLDATGLDFVRSAVMHARATAKRQASTARFAAFNLLDMRQVLVTGAELRFRPGRGALYGRFLLHALDDEARANLWRFARMALRGGGEFCLEFRTGEASEYEFGEHYRQLLRPETVADEIERSGGTVEFQRVGHGMAVYKDEDPCVCRMVASW